MPDLDEKQILPVIGISMGDFNGIGPEVTLKALKFYSDQINAKIVLIGSKHVYRKISEYIAFDLNITEIADSKAIHQNKNKLLLFDIFKNEIVDINYGTVSKQAGLFAARSIEKAVALAMNNEIDCLVTAPISKETLQLAGYNYPGHTEMLAKLTASPTYLMILLVDDFRVALVTTHCSVAKITDLISKEIIIEKLKILHNSLKYDFGITHPKIGVTALNPHAGDGELFGDDEGKKIIPAIESVCSEGIEAYGPFPADSLFQHEKKYKFDAYLAMYHDQGLIPLKMKARGRGVNFTAGLPIIRTSPDHGTAFEIANQFVAKSESMLEAIKLGSELASKRKRS